MLMKAQSKRTVFVIRVARILLLSGETLLARRGRSSWGRSLDARERPIKTFRHRREHCSCPGERGSRRCTYIQYEGSDQPRSSCCLPLTFSQAPTLHHHFQELFGSPHLHRALVLSTLSDERTPSRVEVAKSTSHALTKCFRGCRTAAGTARP